MDWIYGQIVGFLGNFFALMGNMGVELFELEWVSAIILFFSRLAWALFAVYTLTATDHHAVFSRQRVDVFKSNEVVSTQSARQHKDATDLVVDMDEPDNSASAPRGASVLLIRRLTPLECERLQGFPDGWTDIEGASDSARYKALGNSVAIPCVDYVLQGIAWATTAQIA